MRLALRGRLLGDGPELLQHRERVEDPPMLAGKAVVAEPDDVDQLDIDALAGGWHAKELALVSSSRTSARDYLVTAHEDVLRLHSQIGKRGLVHVEELLDPFLCRVESRRLLVLDEVVDEEFAKPVDVTSIDQVVQAPHRGRMVHRV